MDNKNKQKIKDMFLGLLCMAGIISTIQLLFLLFANFILYTNYYIPIFAEKWFLIIQKIVRILLISGIGLIIYKKIKLSKEFSMSLLITLILYLIAVLVTDFIFL